MQRAARTVPSESVRSPTQAGAGSEASDGVHWTCACAAIAVDIVSMKDRVRRAASSRRPSRSSKLH